MRTIKFRIWDYQKMIYPDTEHYFQNAIFWNIKMTEEKSIDKDLVTNYSLMQFTGFHDKTGKEIYDGDIIGDWVEVDGKMEQSRQVVFWHEEGQWMLDNSFHQDRSHFFSLAGELKDFEYEIIGNIHENPELLNN